MSVATTAYAYTNDLYFEGNIGVIGRYNEGTYIRDFNGYIDKLKVTRHLAKYKGNFTPVD